MNKHLAVKYAFNTAIVLMILLLLFTPVLAQDGNRLAIREINNKEFPQMGVRITYSTADMAPFAGLTANEFQILEDGIEVTDFELTSVQEQPLAVVLVIGPIFEADLDPDQYGYRPKRSAQDAVRRVHEWLQCGYREVVDADLSGYFDSIPHRELLKSVARRLSDRPLLGLVKRWLKAPVREDPKGTERGGPGDRTRGTPQGSPLSPLLANVYFRRFLLSWKRRGLERTLQAHIVNYADDFVICCRERAEAQAQEQTRLAMHALDRTSGPAAEALRQLALSLLGRER